MKLRILPNIAAAAALMVGAAAGDAQALELKMLSSWDRSYAVVPAFADEYIKMVEEASKNEIKISRIGPEAVPSFEQFSPVSMGVFDLLFTHGAYHFNHTSVGMAADALKADPAKWRETGIFDYIDESYQKHGLKVIAMPVIKTGYNLILTEPVGEDCDLAGRKIRASPTYMPLLQTLEASPVVLPPAEIYSALEKGIVDGAAWPIIGALNFKWHEVAAYYMRPSFGTVAYPILANLNKWNSLSEQEKTLLTEQGISLENKSIAVLEKVAEEEQTQLQKLGMQETRLCGDALRTVGKDWANGVWSLAIEKSGKEAEMMKALAEKHNLSLAQ